MRLFLCFPFPHPLWLFSIFQVTHRTCPSIRKCDHPAPFQEIAPLTLLSTCFILLHFPLAFYLVFAAFFFLKAKLFPFRLTVHYTFVHRPWSPRALHPWLRLLDPPNLPGTAHPVSAPCQPNLGMNLLDQYLGWVYVEPVGEGQTYLPLDPAKSGQNCSENRFGLR